MSRNKRERLELILTEDDLKFAYTEDELEEFRKYWRRGKVRNLNIIQRIHFVAERMDQGTDNTFLLTLDQIRKGKIE